MTEEWGIHPGRQGKGTEKSEVAFMNAVSEAAVLLRTVAEPRPVGDTVKAAIDRAARRVSRHMLRPMRFRRAEDIWRGEARAIRAEEMDAIRRAAKEDRLIAEAKNELAEITARIARLEAAMGVVDPDFTRPQADALRAATGRVDRSVD